MSISDQQLRDALRSLIHAADQRENVVAAILQLSNALPVAQTQGTANIEGANVDLGRSNRCGFPEVVFAEGKPADLVARILQTQFAAGQRGFATRVSEQHVQAVLAVLPHAQYDLVAKTILVPVETTEPPTQKTEPPQVAVVTAGSCDAPVAQEAMETLRWMNIPCCLIEDIGVAGPQRLQQNVGRLQSMTAIVCVAGMEAALPSVVGGHVSCPVIGVPTSVGYGASFGGVTAMLSMLTCCASNVVTVNIDAGFRGGYVAGIMTQQVRTAALHK